MLLFHQQTTRSRLKKNAKKAIIASDAAIVASGTATLECAVETTPMVVCYKFSWLSWLVANYMVNVKYSSIVNLIAEKKIVPELLQSEMKPEHIKNIIVELLNLESKTRIKMMNNLDKVKIKLGTLAYTLKFEGSIKSYKTIEKMLLKLKIMVLSIILKFIYGSNKKYVNGRKTI